MTQSQGATAPPSDLSQRVAALSPAQRELLAQRLAAGSAAEPLAVVGMGCRFPGGASSPEAFWDLLAAGRDAVVEVPAERWDAGACYDPDPAAPGKTESRWGGFLTDVDRFDAEFFDLSPREAAHVDPQHRLLMEVAWEALEDAGLTREALAGSPTGVFVAVYHRDFARLALAHPAAIDAYTCSGTHHSIAANRLSYHLDLRGPSVVVDTACSSSLVACHLACQSLWRGECDTALVGGANLMFAPEETIAISKWGVMAADGRCKSFDARADGIVRGEGCGVVVLKRLADARAAGDCVHALIRGTAVNQDGRSNGLTAPNAEAQEEVIRRALSAAGVDPAEIGYVETHGTGTSLGDPIEIEALIAVVGAPRDEGLPCLLGAVKANFGHLEAAAGIAGLIKAVLCLEHAAVPPQLHFEKLNPLISLAGTPFVIPTGEPRPWPEAAHPRRAGVSSFGLGGTNAHVILEEGPPEAATDGADDEDPAEHLLAISAHTPAALRRLAAAWRQLLAGQPEFPLRDLCATAALRRSHHGERLAAVGGDREELIEQLDAFLAGEARPGLASGSVPERPFRGLVFVFPGQGSQWRGMGRELYAREEVFRRSIERCEEAIRRHAELSLIAELHADHAAPWEEIDVLQPLLFALQVSLAALWRAWGIEPDAVVGQSLGEVAAAQVAGALELDDAARIICRRSRLLKRLSGRGTLAAVELSLAEAEAALRGFEDRLSIAGSNGPRSSVISGDEEALDEVLARLAAEEVFCRRIRLAVASHGPQVDVLESELLDQLAGLEPRPAQIPIYSTVSAEIVAGEALTASYWMANMRRPVLFWPVVQRLLDEDHATFLEISPHPIALAAIEQGLHHLGRKGQALGSLRRDSGQRAAMLESLAELYRLGFPIRWERLFPAPVRPVRLPPYPFERQRFPIPAPAGDVVARPQLPAAGAPLLDGPPLRLPGPPDGDGGEVCLWQSVLTPERLPQGGHRVAGSTVLSAASYLEMARSAAAAVGGGEVRSVAEVGFRRPLPVVPGEPRALRLLLRTAASDGARFEVYSRPLTAADDDWTFHASGRLDASGPDAADPLGPERLRARCPEARPGISEVLEDVRVGKREALARVVMAPALGEQLRRYRFHPALVDACGELIDVLGGRDDGDYILASLERATFYGPAGEVAWSHVRVDEAPAVGGRRADLHLLAADGTVVAELRGLRLVAPAAAGELRDCFFEVRWQPVPRGDEAGAGEASWLILSDGGELAGELARRARAAGERCLVAAPGERFERLDQERFRCCADDLPKLLAAVFAIAAAAPWRVVYLWGLATPEPWEIPPDELEATVERPATALIRLVQALSQRAWAQPPRLWVVTEDVQVITGQERTRLSLAPLWGLGRVIAVEHPPIFAGLVDLEAGRDAAGAAALLRGEITAEDGEQQIAYRGPTRYGARLEAREPPPAPPNVALRPRPGASYLITGGLGGLGLALARRLVERGARRLVLLGRTPPPPRPTWHQLDEADPWHRRLGIVRELEHLGASIHLAAVDVGDPASLAAFLDQFRSEGWPPIRGVFHAAGVQVVRAVEDLDAASLRADFRPKVAGGWLLHRALEKTELDFFVLYSSVASFLAVPFLGGYAAANCFLDALAQHRRRHSLPVLSVNWGLWGEVGMAIRYREQRGNERSFTARGLEAFSPGQGLDALERLLAAPGEGPIAVMPIDWQEWSRSYPEAARSPLFRPLASRARGRPEAAEGAAPEAPVLNRRTLLAAPDRAPLVTDYLRTRVARVLRRSAAELPMDRPLTRLGIDSLMATELRNHLEADLGVGLSIVKVLGMPGISQLVEQVLAAIEPEADGWEELTL